MSEISVLLAGDALISRPYVPRADPRLLSLIARCDARFVNFEMLINDYSGTPAVEAGGLHLSAPIEIGRDLLNSGFNLFATANNHSLDFGTDGLITHIDAMNRLGMKFAGVGAALGEASAPTFLDTANGRVALISCASSFATGQRAGERRADFGGRPGLNPLRVKTTVRLEDDLYEQLERISEATRLAEVNRWIEHMEFRPPPDDPENQMFFFGRSLHDGPIFERYERSEVHTDPNPGDLERIVREVEHARRQADLVIVSIHAHEAEVHFDKPARFIQAFAHACIDAGADIITGSGPHVMRGIELYDRKPIFYSLGNLWFEFETVNRLPSDSYEMWRLDPANSTPADLYDNGLLGFHKDGRYWECALPVCTYKDRELTSIELHCMSLGFGEPRSRRGTPHHASIEDAERIVGYVAELSVPFGTELGFVDGQGRVEL